MRICPRLDVSTPASSFIDGVINATGVINELNVDSLLKGTAPSSTSGKVQIDGQINALQGISLNAPQVIVNGALVTGIDALHERKFIESVNTSGLTVPTAIVEENGTLDIVGVAVTGATLAVNQGARIQTGTSDITIAATSSDVAAGMGDRTASASVLVDGALTGANITVAATASAHSDGSGDADNLVKAAPLDKIGVDLNWADATSDASASITIGSHARIKASGYTRIDAQASQVNKIAVEVGKSDDDQDDQDNAGGNQDDAKKASSAIVHGSLAGGAVCNRKGSETNASPWAQNAQIAVSDDNANRGRLNRSIASIGAGCAA